MCAPLGVVVALPALRLKGLYLALATIAFAQLADSLLFRHPAIISQVDQTGNLYKPLDLFGFRISSDAADRKAFVIFLADRVRRAVLPDRGAPADPVGAPVDRDRRQPGGVGHRSGST